MIENVRLATQARAGVHYEMTRPWMARRDLIDRAERARRGRPCAAGATQRVASLSHGDQRKLEVAMMMALEPEILMFDEPTAGMSVDEVPVVLDLIARLKQDKIKTILLVEHKMDVVRSLADRIIVLHNGRLAADGEPGEVIASPIVQEAYLGDRAGERRRERAARPRKASTPISGATTSCRASISTRRRARRRCCWAATAPARRLPAHDHGPVARLAGRIELGDAAIAALPASDVARAGVAYVPETMAVFSDLSVKENLVLGAREGPLDDGAAAMDFRVFPGAEEILAVARGLAVGRPEADGVDRPRDRRAAPAAADRRADQGPRAGDHRRR